MTVSVDFEYIIIIMYPKTQTVTVVNKLTCKSETYTFSDLIRILEKRKEIDKWL